MGLFDAVELPAELRLPELEANPVTIEWQTKTIDRPSMARFRLTPDGRLLQEEAHCEGVPEPERPSYGTDGCEDMAFVGSIRRVHDGWAERRYHGTFEIHASLDERFARYELRFAHGRLDAIRDVSDEEPGSWVPADGVPPATPIQLSDVDVSRLESLLARLTAELDADDESGDDVCAVHHVGNRLALGLGVEHLGFPLPTVVRTDGGLGVPVVDRGHDNHHTGAANQRIEANPPRRLR